MSMSAVAKPSFGIKNWSWNSRSTSTSTHNRIYVLRCAASSRHVDWMRFRSDGGHFIPSFLGVTGLKSLMAGEPRLSSSRFTADVGVSFIMLSSRNDAP